MRRIFQFYIEQNSIQLYSSNSVISKCPYYRFETLCLVHDITLLDKRVVKKYTFESKFDFEYKSRLTNIFCLGITLTSFQKRTFPHECYQLRCDHNVTSSLGPSSPIPQSQFELPSAPGVQLTSKSCVQQSRCSLSLDLSTPLLACMCSVGETNKLVHNK